MSTKLDSIEENKAYESLLYAVIGRAVEDYKLLREEGIICEGKIIDVWPKFPSGNSKRFVMEYNKRQLVLELMYFLETDLLERYLDLTTTDICADSVRKKLNITKRK